MLLLGLRRGSVAEEPVVCRLLARGNQIRTNSPIVLFAVGQADRETISISAAGRVRPFLRGTDGSRPACSRGESGELPTTTRPPLESGPRRRKARRRSERSRRSPRTNLDRPNEATRTIRPL